MAFEISKDTLTDILNWAYEQAIAGGAGLDSAITMAQEYQKDEGAVRDQVDSLIRWQNAKAGTSGFITGLGGLLTLPATIPANIATVMFVQVRMIAAIAHMGGYDVNDDKVRTMVFCCLTGSQAAEIFKEVGIRVGAKMAESAIKQIPGKTIIAINQKVGFRLLTKFGEKGVVNMGKAVPLVGGAVGAVFDAVTTNIVGNVARDTFVPVAEPEDVAEAN